MGEKAGPLPKILAFQASGFMQAQTDQLSYRPCNWFSLSHRGKTVCRRNQSILPFSSFGADDFNLLLMSREEST